ncbi:MAG: hypothetical protein K2H41_13485 [Acetatifactor sp.]|nr:hypothetical protein [Acetatifactor sp.]MDE6701065.1 hypothetical protein [Acetatifactor sp.]MDE7113159.1 hypothetical protein [Acetatifactor sp.]
MKFNLSVDKWNLVSEKGLPEDGEWCFLVWKTEDGELQWSIGGYDESEENFYVDFGMGGMVLDAKDVIAWAVCFGDETFTVQ